MQHKPREFKSLYANLNTYNKYNSENGTFICSYIEEEFKTESDAHLSLRYSGTQSGITRTLKSSRSFIQSALDHCPEVLAELWNDEEKPPVDTIHSLLYKIIATKDDLYIKKIMATFTGKALFLEQQKDPFGIGVIYWVTFCSSSHSLWLTILQSVLDIGVSIDTRSRYTDRHLLDTVFSEIKQSRNNVTPIFLQLKKTFLERTLPSFTTQIEALFAQEEKEPTSKTCFDAIKKLIKEKPIVLQHHFWLQAAVCSRQDTDKYFFETFKQFHQHIKEGHCSDDYSFEVAQEVLSSFKTLVKEEKENFQKTLVEQYQKLDSAVAFQVMSTFMNHVILDKKPDSNGNRVVSKTDADFLAILRDHPFSQPRAKKEKEAVVKKSIFAVPRTASQTNSDAALRLTR